MVRRSETGLDGPKTRVRRERPHPLTHRASRIPRVAPASPRTLIACFCHRRVPEAENRRAKHCVGGGRDSVPNAKVEVKIVRIAFCTIRIGVSSPDARLQICCQGLATTTAAKVTAPKSQNWAGATPLFCGQAAQKFLGVAPTLDALRVGLFCAVLSRHKQSFLHTLLNSACRKGEDPLQS